MISCFQSDYKECVLKADNMTMEVFCALTNSNVKFISSVRSFMEKVNRDSGMDLADIQKALSYSIIIKNFAQISNSAFVRIQELLVFQINQAFSKVKDYEKLNLEEFLTNTFKELFPIFDMLVSTYSKKLWSHIYVEFSRIFAKMIILLSSKYKTSKISDLTKKIENDKQLVMEIFGEKASKKDKKLGDDIIESVYGVFTLPIDEIINSIIVLRVQLGEVFNDKFMVKYKIKY